MMEHEQRRSSRGIVRYSGIRNNSQFLFVRRSVGTMRLNASLSLLLVVWTLMPCDVYV
jgi:hypothetical protein